jgi:hypothetical protein
MDKSQTFPSPLTGEGKGGGENILTPLTLILPHKGGGNFLCCLPMNSKGISVLFLVIAMLLMITIGYVFSYLIPTKQKSVRFPIYSTQAFYIAQSGVEFAIRYSSDQGWRGATETPSNTFDLDRLDNIWRDLGNGRFTIVYDRPTDTLTSTGQITGSSENRVVRVSNFRHFLVLTFSVSPCWVTANRRIQFTIINETTHNVILHAFSATWVENRIPPRYIDRIRFGGTNRWTGTYNNGSGIVDFSSSQTVAPNTPIIADIRWNGAMTNPRNIVITFYTTAGASTGEGFKFNLDPDINNLPNC